MIRRLVLAAALAVAALPVAAQVRIGLMVSATGPTTAIGIPQKNTGDLLPRTVGGVAVEYFQLDDGGDTTRGVQNAKKLLQEHNIDALIGPSTTPIALAILDLIAEGKVPLMATVGTSSVVEPLDAKRRWVYKTTQNDDLIAEALIKHMKKTGVANVGFIGFNDPYGENWLKVFGALAEKAGIKLAAVERYNRADQSVIGQSLKLIAAKPDAVLVAGVGGPGVLPQITLRDQGYKGPIYQTHGVATDDFIRLGGAKVEGTILAAGPMLVIDEIPDSEPGQGGGEALHRGVRGEVRQQAGDVRREHVGRVADPGACDPGGPQEGQAGDRSVPHRAARRDRAGARDRRLPGRVQHERDQPQRHGRAGARAGHRQGRQVPAAAGIGRDGVTARLVGVLLAAGRGERFGGGKLVAPLPGTGVAVGVAALRNLRAALPDVVAVVRPGDDVLAGVLAAEGARVVRAERAAEGMGASLAAGVDAAGAADGYVVALADMPWIAPATMARIARCIGTRCDHRRAAPRRRTRPPRRLRRLVARRSFSPWAATRARSACWPRTARRCS